MNFSGMRKNADRIFRSIVRPDEELDLLRNLKKSRGDVLLQFNAMVAEFAHKPDEERFRAVIHGKSFDWWRNHLITALEFFDRMRDKTLNMGG